MRNDAEELKTCFPTARDLSNFINHKTILALRLHHQSKSSQSGPVSCPWVTTAVVLNYGTMDDVDPASLTKVLLYICSEGRATISCHICHPEFMICMSPFFEDNSSAEWMFTKSSGRAFGISTLQCQLRRSTNDSTTRSRQWTLHAIQCSGTTICKTPFHPAHCQCAVRSHFQSPPRRRTL